MNNIYNYQVRSTTSTGRYNNTEMRTITLDTTNPSISFDTGTLNNNYTFFAYANQTSNLSISNITSKWNVTIVSAAAANIAPNITAVYNGTTVSLNSGPLATSVIINFTAYDPDGNLNDSTATVNVSRANEITRENTSCSKYESAGNYANFTCNITMWWFDGAGAWNVTASIWDNAGASVKNTSTTISLPAVTGFEISPGNLTWTAFAPGSTNQTSNNDPLNLTNIGNQPVGDITGNSNISVNATDLLGETNSAFALFANNFTVSTITGGTCTGAACTECDNASGSYLNVTAYQNISKAVLPKGNYTIGDIATGREQLYFCIRTSGFDLTTQAYSTAGQGVWTVMIS
jgi:hypothetical protein